MRWKLKRWREKEKKSTHNSLQVFGKSTTTTSPLCESLIIMFVRKRDTQFSSYYCSVTTVFDVCIPVGHKCFSKRLRRIGKSFVYNFLLFLSEYSLSCCMLWCMCGDFVVFFCCCLLLLLLLAFVVVQVLFLLNAKVSRWWVNSLCCFKCSNEKKRKEK